MTDYDALDAEAKEIATEASKQGKFSFLDRLASREYPYEDVEIYINERAGHRIKLLRDELSLTKDEAKSEELIAEIERQRELAKASRYTVRVEGISVEDWDGLVDAANEAYPVEYDEETHPLTMAKIKTPRPSDERETFFRTHSWAKFIRSVTDPDGAVDDAITPEWIAAFISHAPIVALAKIQVAIDKARMTTEWMDAIQTDDFLAKS